MDTDKHTTPSINFRQLALLMIFPIIIFSYALIIKEARGPYYYSFGDDPEYAYLLNGLNFTQGVGPHHVDHPGTPLQVSVMASLQAWHPSIEKDSSYDIIESVLLKPEQYLSRIQLSLSALFSAVLFSLGWTVYRSSQSLTKALIIQSSPLWFPTICVSLSRVHAESLILIIGYGLCILLYPLITKQQSQRTGILRSSLTGVLIATGVMTKVTFAPIAVLFLLLIKSYKAKIVYCATTISILCLWAIPILGRRDYYITWITNLATRTERYGSGEVGLFNIENLAFIPTCFSKEPVYALALLGLLGFVINEFRSGLHAQQPIKTCIQTAKQPLILLALFQLAFFVFIIKHPGIHYLSPALPLLTLTWVCLSDQLSGRLFDVMKQHRRLIQTASILCLICLIFKHSMTIVEIRQTYKESKAAEAFAASLPDDYLVTTAYGASSKPFALNLGDMFAGSHYANKLVELYPDDEVWFSVWASEFYKKRTGTDLPELKEQTNTIIVWGGNMRRPEDGVGNPYNHFPFLRLKTIGKESFWIYTFGKDSL